MNTSVIIPNKIHVAISLSILSLACVAKRDFFVAFFNFFSVVFSFFKNFTEHFTKFYFNKSNFCMAT